MLHEKESVCVCVWGGGGGHQSIEASTVLLLLVVTARRLDPPQEAETITGTRKQIQRLSISINQST
jgi:hypothetical protein